MLFSQQDLATALISFTAGIVSALAALSGIYFQQWLTNKSFIREKIELTYTSSNQVEDWTSLQVSTLEDLVEMKKNPGKSTGTGHTPGDGDCPIDTIVTCVSLYLPNLRKRVNIDAYRSTIKEIRALCDKVKYAGAASEIDLNEAKVLHERFDKQNTKLQSQLEHIVPFKHTIGL